MTFEPDTENLLELEFLQRPCAKSLSFWPKILLVFGKRTQKSLILKDLQENSANAMTISKTLAQQCSFFLQGVCPDWKPRAHHPDVRPERRRRRGQRGQVPDHADAVLADHGSGTVGLGGTPHLVIDIVVMRVVLAGSGAQLRVPHAIREQGEICHTGGNLIINLKPFLNLSYPIFKPKLDHFWPELRQFPCTYLGRVFSINSCKHF